MTATSPLFYVSLIDPASYESDSTYSPVDVATAWLVRNNLAHLIDESCQVRINWVGSADGSNGWVSNDPTTRIWTHVYPHTWLAPDKPANVDIYVGAAVLGGDTMTVRARIIPASAPLGDLNAPSLIDITGTTTSSTLDIVIDQQNIVSGNIAGLWSASKETAHGITDNATLGIASALQSLMRLELHCVTDNTLDPVCGIGQVYLREYA